eukprot:m.84176 g.84176  ORF g.84176 m.84176 type:complete len:374 (+) comp15007_c0_seq1:334-1455(+)
MWWLLAWIVSFFMPATLVALLGNLSLAILPVVVIRYLWREPIKAKRVAVVGGGIAGCAAAYSLARSGCHVTLYEKREVLGGNAKTTVWPTDPAVVTGLSVLAWPDKYFHNYNELLKQFGIKTEVVRLPFFLHNPGKRVIFAHGSMPSGNKNARNLRISLRFDFLRWRLLVNVVRVSNAWLAWAPFAPPSLYTLSFLNPFNIISLRLLCRLFCISADFWEDVIVPIYSSSFLTVNLDSVPSVIVPVLDDLISVGSTPEMRTWSGTSTEVFSKMTADVDVRLGADIQVIETVPSERAPTPVVQEDQPPHGALKRAFKAKARRQSAVVLVTVADNSSSSRSKRRQKARSSSRQWPTSWWPWRRSSPCCSGTLSSRS